MSKRNLWIGAGFFLVLATGFSGLFRPGHFDFYNQGQFHPLVTLAIAVFLIGWGPAIAAAISWNIFKDAKRRSSLFGNARRAGVIMAFVPPAVLAVTGMPNDYGMNTHLVGAIMGALIFIYALGEEIGWRGYMNDTLGALRLPLRACVIGICWWGWHLWFLGGSPVSQQLIMLPVLIGVSALLCAVTDSSRSWMVAAAFHSFGNIAFMAGVITLPMQTRLIAGVVCLVVMITIYHYWIPVQSEGDAS